MSLANFIPEIWSRQLNISLRKRLVGLNIVNQNYEGEIRNAGDILHINRPASVTVGTYVPGTPISVQAPTSTQKNLLIDQFKYVALEIDDVYKVQSNVNLLRAYGDEASYYSQNTVDAFLLAFYASADSSNVIAKAALTKTNIWTKLAEANENLSINNVPGDGRFIVLSPAEIRYLTESTEFTAASTLGDDTKRNGFRGRAAGFDVFESNNLSTVSDASSDNIRHCIYGHPSAITFGMQHTSMEMARRELQFSDLVKGLMIYGAVAVKPEALGDLRSTV